MSLLMRYEKHMLAAVCGGGEDVGVAAVFQLQLLAQYSHGHGEIAHGDVGAGDIAQSLFQLPFVERRDVSTANRLPGKPWMSCSEVKRWLLSLIWRAPNVSSNSRKHPAFMTEALGS